MYSTENAAVCDNGTATLPASVDKDSAAYIVWISVGRIVILALASWHILSEVRCRKDSNTGLVMGIII